MTQPIPTYPFEMDFGLMQANIDQCVDVIFSGLQSDFLAMPKGEGFVGYGDFGRAYESLKRATAGFRTVEPARVLEAFAEEPLSLVVLRTILGLTPPEWGYLATARTHTDVPQGYVRTLDRRLRTAPHGHFAVAGETGERIRALVATACALLNDGAPSPNATLVHRMEKVDTIQGVESLRAASQLGVPYCMLLYERLLGRPFAAHRDSVSELIGAGLEVAVAAVLDKAGITYRQTGRAEKVTGFDQAPDFVVPDEFSPRVVIEAKISEDDGTARDKVTRIQHLAELSLLHATYDSPRFQVIACIGGRGFGVRREDMRKMLLATRGKVFTFQMLDRMVQCTELRQFATR